MVVCKCRKATKWYCFVHKTPVCGECICQDQHAICVVKTYSEWVVDGDYDWPPKCAVCQQELVEGDNSTVRLACLDILHTNCLKQHIQSFPPHTAPAGYVCPACPNVLWPPKDAREINSSLGQKLKAVIGQTDVADVLLFVEPKVLGALPAAQASTDSTSSAPGDGVPGSDSAVGGAGGLVDGIAGAAKQGAADGHASIAIHGSQLPPMTTSRKAAGGKGAAQAPLDSPGAAPYRDTDAAHMKYARRGSWYTRTLQQLVPAFFSSPSLPLHTKPDGQTEDGASEQSTGRKRRRRDVDPSKLILGLAILSCLATMLLLFIRLS